MSSREPRAAPTRIVARARSPPRLVAAPCLLPRLGHVSPPASCLLPRLVTPETRVGEHERAASPNLIRWRGLTTPSAIPRRSVSPCCTSGGGTACVPVSSYTLFARAPGGDAVLALGTNQALSVDVHGRSAVTIKQQCGAGAALSSMSVDIDALRAAYAASVSATTPAPATQVSSRDGTVPPLRSRTARARRLRDCAPDAVWQEEPLTCTWDGRTYPFNQVWDGDNGDKCTCIQGVAEWCARHSRPRPPSRTSPRAPPLPLALPAPPRAPCSLTSPPFPRLLSRAHACSPRVRSGGGFQRRIYFDNGAVAGVSISAVIIASVLAGCAYFQYMQKISREANEGRRRSVSGVTYQGSLAKPQRGQQEIELPRACAGVGMESSAV